MKTAASATTDYMPNPLQQMKDDLNRMSKKGEDFLQIYLPAFRQALLVSCLSSPNDNGTSYMSHLRRGSLYLTDVFYVHHLWDNNM